jgi:hypothetical protein
MIDPELSAEYDYNFLITFATAFETWNPGSIAKIYITVVNGEERFDGFCVCFQPQILRIARADIRAFTLDACFIKHEKNGRKGWALYTLCSMDFKRQHGLPGPLPLRQGKPRGLRQATW